MVLLRRGTKSIALNNLKLSSLPSLRPFVKISTKGFRSTNFIYMKYNRASNCIFYN